MKTSVRSWSLRHKNRNISKTLLMEVFHLMFSRVLDPYAGPAVLCVLWWVWRIYINIYISGLLVMGKIMSSLCSSGPLC